MKPNRVCVLACLAALVVAGNARGELITNGGFETGNFSGWSTSGNTGVLGSHWGVTPYEGSFMAVLSPLGVLNSSLSQTIVAGPFTTIEVSFAYRLKGLDFVGPLDLGTDRLVITANSTVLANIPLNDLYDGTQPPHNQAPSDTGWLTYHSFFDVFVDLGGDPITLTFQLRNLNNQGGDPLQSTTAYIDDVSINGLSHLPEPSSLVLMGLALSGLAGYGWRCRRRQQAVT